MVTYRVLRFPAARPREGAPLGDPYDAPTILDAGKVAAERIGTPERGWSYWLEYLDQRDQWQSAGAVVGGPPSG